MQTQCKFKIGEREFIAKFPNVGQIIDMESLKQVLTNNRYGVMASSGITSMFYALDIVDAISFYQICVPSVAKYFDIKNYTAMSPDEIKELVDAYNEVIKPWYNETMEELRGITKDDEAVSEKDGEAEG